ncbi:MAG TPA: DNA/RNA nuclease SfsA [Deltaproteobacteria bacterium]|nr:DNA/RNA nuclease SfsA [Deltaproteobacteria bacterium]
MIFEPPLIPGRLIRRYKRFLVDVDLDDGRRITAHCPNTGAMRGIQIVGGRVWLQPSTNPKRKLPWTWKLVRVGHAWVHVDAVQGSRLAVEAITAGLIPELSGALQTEVPLGGSRIDLRVGESYVEVKSTTLVEGRTARFPDAVTERGRRHVEALTASVQGGGRAAILFGIQRPDVDGFSPADAVDPEFSEALRRASGAGVAVFALAARVSPRRVALVRRIPVWL